MRVPIAMIAILAAAASVEPAAAQSAQGTAGTQISEASGIVVLQDVVTKVSASIVVTGSAGDAVSLAVPETVSVTSPAGDTMNLTTGSQLSSNNLFLSGDSVSVSIGALAEAPSGASPGSYGGVMVVLAQYN